MQPTFRIVAATALFAVVHSALASRAVKATVARAVGTQAFDAWYRPLYVVQSLAASAALLRYGLAMPDRTVYRVRPPASLLLRAGQLLACVELARGIRAAGFERLTGIDGLREHLRRGTPFPAPVAQGPERDAKGGALRYGGPFLASRHPLNFWAVPLFWLTPRLTTRRLTFNLAATLYLFVGSRHEEARLAAEYGDEYRAYVASGPAFFVPRPRRLPRPAH